MASTLTPSDALTFCKEMISSMPIDRVQYAVATDALGTFWTAAPWSWTVGFLTPITLAAGSQAFNVVSPPSDFLKLETCWITNGNTYKPIKPVSSIPTGSQISELPSFVQYTGTQIVFDQLVGSLKSGDVWKFYSTYKKQAPVISVSNFSTTGVLVSDDSYFWVYREIFLYYAYKYGYDSRAGGAEVTVNPAGQRQVAYNGQLGRAMAAIEELRIIENVLPQYPDPNPNPMKSR